VEGHSQINAAVKNSNEGLRVSYGRCCNVEILSLDAVNEEMAVVYYISARTTLACESLDIRAESGSNPDDSNT
jgi:hypothetical protein